jgi:hypothetical protein
MTGFQTPLYKLSEYMQWATSGKIQDRLDLLELRPADDRRTPCSAVPPATMYLNRPSLLRTGDPVVLA